MAFWSRRLSASLDVDVLREGFESGGDRGDVLTLRFVGEFLLRLKEATVGVVGDLRLFFAVTIRGALVVIVVVIIAGLGCCCFAERDSEEGSRFTPVLICWAEFKWLEDAAD